MVNPRCGRPRIVAVWGRCEDLAEDLPGDVSGNADRLFTGRVGQVGEQREGLAELGRGRREHAVPAELVGHLGNLLAAGVRLLVVGVGLKIAESEAGGRSRAGAAQVKHVGDGDGGGHEDARVDLGQQIGVVDRVDQVSVRLDDDRRQRVAQVQDGEPALGAPAAIPEPAVERPRRVRGYRVPQPGAVHCGDRHRRDPDRERLVHRAPTSPHRRAQPR